MSNFGKNRCQSAIDGLRTNKFPLNRSLSMASRQSNPLDLVSSSNDCSRIICQRKTAAPGQVFYNKWFIPVKNRLRRSVSRHKPDRSSEDFFYRQLFHQHYSNPENPFQRIANEKFIHFQKIPKKGLSLIQEFRKTQILKRKRVPQIIEMLNDFTGHRYGK